MPTPIQSSSVTAKLRSFFRLRGRQIFTLDETVVPTTQVEDLTDAPYRSNHQVRWKCGNRFTMSTIPGRLFMVCVNTSRAPVMDLSDVPGVAVIEEMTLQSDLPQLPSGSRTWIFHLAAHQGFLNSVEPGAVVTAIGQDVDAARNVGVAAGLIQGQVPVRLNMVQQNLAPDIGATLPLGLHRMDDDQPGGVIGGRGVPVRCTLAEQVTIGDNVCLLAVNTAASTGGSVIVVVSGSYYPLARS